MTDTTNKVLTEKQLREAEFALALKEFYANGGQTTLVPAQRAKR